MSALLGPVIAYSHREVVLYDHPVARKIAGSFISAPLQRGIIMGVPPCQGGIVKVERDIGYYI